MPVLKFPFEKRPSEIFGNVFRPIARICFWSKRINQWVEIVMIVDTGADYTLLPRFYAFELGIDIHRDCTLYPTSGIGGTEKVYLLKRAKVKLGKWQYKVPVGFLNRDDIPPLLGRQGFLEKLKLTFYKHFTYISI